MRRSISIFRRSRCPTVSATDASSLAVRANSTRLVTAAPVKWCTSPVSIGKTPRAVGRRLILSRSMRRARRTAFSPLIMFEIKAGDKVNEHLRALFPTIGYRLFRQLGGAPILVPDDAQQPVDGYELNMFAAKPDLVSALSQQGLLVDAVPAWMPSADNCKIAESFWQSRKFAPQINLSVGNGTHVDSDYCNSLAAYATWRAADQPVA